MDLLTALAAAALLTRIGFALYMAGMVRAKNSAGAVLRTLCDLCVSSLAFWAFGAAILFSNGRIFGFNTDFLFGWNISVRDASMPAIFLHASVFLMATGVVAGATAERFRFFPLCAASVLLSGLLLPLQASWIWSPQGWLHQLGFFDIGGASAIHVSAGICATVASLVVGARTGKYHRDGSSSMIPGHNVPLAAAGALLMGVGWIPYLIGCTVARVAAEPGNAAATALSVLLSGAAAGLVSLVLGHIKYRKPDVILTLIGFLGGIVAASAGAAALPGWGAVLIGTVAGIIVPLAAVAIDLRARLDDAAGVIAIYVVGGAWGTLATGLFVPLTKHGSQTRLAQIGVHLLVQLTGLLAIAVFSALISAALFIAMKATFRIRAREADEFDGLDLAEHDIGAYPDFQQTTIKSYHLREM